MLKTLVAEIAIEGFASAVLPRLAAFRRQRSLIPLREAEVAGEDQAAALVTLGSI